ncbi:hypothetical protein FGU46_01500 [Methanobacterium sp. CWC-01]|nr:hypothetical protein FGU46_01500 [Methanobacterium sp. CWC-01]
MEEKTRWRRIPLISDFIYLLSIVSWKLATWKPHQRYLKFKARDEKCNQCGICADICPAHYNNGQLSRNW